MNKGMAIFKLYPEAVRFQDNKAYDINGDEVAYNEAAVQAEVDANAYKEQRASEYPPLTEQLDMLYWDKINGTNNWETMITTVKNLYPKPTE